MMRSTFHAGTAALGGGLLALTMLLAACGGDGSAGSGHDMGSASDSPTPSQSRTGTPATGPHNDADVAFATGMIPHHGQAVAMAGLAKTRAASAQVKRLAADIKAAQGPEIAQMSGWLAGWSEKVPDPDSMAMGMDHDMGDMGGDTASGMGGMMSSEDMSALMSASGATFDMMWLRGMVAHHEGAVEMSQVELEDGTNPAARQLAQAIIDAQQAEIAAMRSLLAEGLNAAR